MTSAEKEDSYPVTDDDFRDKDRWQFEERLREEVHKANLETRGESQAPWEVIMEALIALKHDMESR